MANMVSCKSCGGAGEGGCCRNEGCAGPGEAGTARKANCRTKKTGADLVTLLDARTNARIGSFGSGGLQLKNTD